MGCPYRWTTLITILILSWMSAVFGQNLTGRQKSQAENPNKEWNNNVSSKSQLMNTLLSMAAANGVLPDLSPVLQPSKELQYQCQSVKDVPKTLNLIQLSPNSNQRMNEPIVLTGKPVTHVNQPSHVLVSPAPVTSSSQSYIPSQHSFMPQMYVSPVPEAVKLENVRNGYSNSGIFQSIPAIWQPQLTTEISREMPTNLHIFSSSLQDNEDASIEDIRPASIVIPSEIPNEGSDGPSLPYNLQINLPAQNIPAPKITVVSAAPASPAPVPMPERSQQFHPFPPFFPPPIIVEKTDSLNSWLPIMLIALFANDRGNGGGCNCNCCCPSNSNSKTIPIPYPIPMPINNPIINRSANRTQKMPESESNEDDDDDDNDDNQDGGDADNNDR